jgi:capsular exopolysaccharide synthesis family protein
VGIGTAELKNDWTEDELTRAVGGQLMADLSVTPVRLSQLVKISYESPDPELAARIANALARQYIESERAERYSMTQQVSQQLQERLSDLRQKLTASEKALQAYREQKGIVALGGSANAMVGQAIGDMTQRLGEARARRAALEGQYQQARAAAGGDLSSIPYVARSPQVASAQARVNDAQTKLTTMLDTLGTAHHRVKQAEAELADLRATLQREEATALAGLNREYEAARATEQSLASAMASARGAVQNVNREEFELAVLEREYQSNRGLFDMFMNRAKETNLAGDIIPSLARVVDHAVPAGAPVKPKKPQIVLVALVLALFMGSLAAVVLDRLDNTIKGGDDAEARLRLPVLATLPEVPKSDRARMVRLFNDQSHSHFAEGIRTARTGVLLSSLDVPHKTLLVTSTLPEEGKTTVAINLALAHAQTKNTLLVDCDMRRSQVSHALGLPPGVKGLTNLLAGTATMNQCIALVQGTGLLVMPVGDMPPNPLDLLLSKKFKDVLAELSEQFEMVIIDSPPVELVSEALVLAPMVTSTTLVVRAMSTPAPLVRKTLTRLQRAGGNMLGVIVNKLDFKHAQRYYGEYGSSTYTYGSYGYAPQVEGAAEGAPVRKAKARMTMKASSSLRSESGSIPS